MAGRRWPRDAWAAWRQGRRAVDRTAVPYEELLALPHDEVRRRLGLRPPEAVHRGGVPRSASSALSRRQEREASAAA